MLKKLLTIRQKYRKSTRLARLRKAIPPYLLKEFETEPNFKLWTTKGARFTASYHTETQQRLSGLCLGYLCYPIIVGLVKLLFPVF